MDGVGDSEMWMV